MPKRFWAFEEGGGAGQSSTLRLEGPIAEESWWGDEVTPEMFRAELASHPGDLTVYINSPGGDVVAGSLIYSMLKEHNGQITVRIDGLAASAASVVAMAGDRVEMAPTAYMMIHNAATVAMGNKADMQAAAEMLEEVDRGIRTAYQLKTGKSERELVKMMDAETWMSAAKALEEGFIDAISYGEPLPAAPEDPATTDSTARVLQSHLCAGDRIRPAVAYSARKQQQITAQAAAQRAAMKHPENQLEQADAARSRLCLLIL
ncbi:MAG: Clp protease ClpP [Clostridia bacterium]|nr:Clp protease ClpP [Clostridia bacterium]